MCAVLHHVNFQGSVCSLNIVAYSVVTDVCSLASYIKAFCYSFVDTEEVWFPMYVHCPVVVCAFYLSGHSSKVSTHSFPGMHSVYTTFFIISFCIQIILVSIPRKTLLRKYNSVIGSTYWSQQLLALSIQFYLISHLQCIYLFCLTN